MWRNYLTIIFLVIFVALNAQDPVPYPDVETEESSKKVDVKEGGQQNQSASGDETGTSKGIVSGISTGKTHFIGVGGINVKFEGKSVSLSGNPGISSQSAALNCDSDPNSCNEFIYEIMKAKLLPATPRSLGFHKTDSKSLESIIDAKLSSDLKKKTQGKPGLWIKLKNGKWIRIDKNIDLVKAAINQLWRRGK